MVTSESLKEISNYDSEFEGFFDQIADMQRTVEDISYTSGKSIGKMESSEQEFENISERISKYNELIRKMGVGSVSELVESHRKLISELESMKDSRGELKELFLKSQWI